MSEAGGATAADFFSGTKPVEERHRFDEARLDTWMRENVEDYRGPLTVSQFTRIARYARAIRASASS